jgi:ferredoxin-fold anticodon binding domain-containing protein
MLTKERKIEYRHVRVKKNTHDELRKFKNLYELQDKRSYSIDDTINLLMRDRVDKEFILPITTDKKEAKTLVR